MDERLGGLGGRRVLVTGGTGFLGSHLTRSLVDLGSDVHLLTTGTTRPALGPLPERVRVHEATLIERSSVEAAVRSARPEVVFHLGGFTHVGRSWSEADVCVRVNVEGTVNLLGALTDERCDRIVHASSADVYGNGRVPFVETAEPRPASPYAVSKRAAELFCQLAADSHGWPIVQLRVFNSYGPGQTPDRLVPEIITHGLQRAELKMTRGTQTREFNYVADIVRGLLLAGVVDGIDGEILNLGGGEETSVADLAETVLDLMGNPIVAQLGALPERPVEVERMFGDASKAETLLGWKPDFTLREGLASTIDWYASHHS